MKRSTHADRVQAWAGKQAGPGYRAKKIVPAAADLIKKKVPSSLSIKEQEGFGEGETIKTQS